MTNIEQKVADELRPSTRTLVAALRRRGMPEAAIREALLGPVREVLSRPELYDRAELEATRRVAPLIIDQELAP